jgi:hypothetical protein
MAEFACDDDTRTPFLIKLDADMQTASAMVVLTRELERLRDKCDPERYPGDIGRKEAFNEAIQLASSAALLAMGVGRRQR